MELREFQRNVGELAGRQVDLLVSQGSVRVGVQVSDKSKVGYEIDAALDLAGVLDWVVIVCVETKKAEQVRRELDAVAENAQGRLFESGDVGELVQRVRVTTAKEVVSGEMDLVVLMGGEE